MEKTNSSSVSTRESKQRPRPVNIHVLTDGTGGLPRHILAAVLSQFPEQRPKPAYHVFCDAKKIRQVLLREIEANSIVLHAFAEKTNKRLLNKLAVERDVPAWDLTGGVVEFIREHTGWRVISDPNRVHVNDDRYFDRIDAWEFTMQHDDSRRLKSLNKADIVLIGLSRVSKSPTSAYLGWLGHRVANISFVPEMGVPSELMKCRRRAVALTMQPRRLSEIRNRRMEMNGFRARSGSRVPEIQYGGLRDTIREVAAAEQIYRKLKLPMIDVTESTVEETAARVLDLLGIE